MDFDSALHQWIMLILSKQIAAANAGRPNQPTIADTPHSPESEYWQARCVNSAIEISNILARHRVEWGNDHFPVIIMRPVSLAPLALLEGLAERPESQDALVELCITIFAASRRFAVGRGVLGAIQSTAEHAGIQLPAQCRQLIDTMTRAANADKLTTQPTPLPSTGLQWLLEKWDDLELE